MLASASRRRREQIRTPRRNLPKAARRAFPVGTPAPATPRSGQHPPGSTASDSARAHTFLEAAAAITAELFLLQFVVRRRDPGQPRIRATIGANPRDD